MSRPKIRLVQLPIPQACALAPTGNVPLAAGALCVAARVHGLTERADIEVTPLETTESLGDTALADAIADGEPAIVGASLYLWNSERTLHVLREVRRRSPRTRIVVGGPEVGPDNPWLLASDAFDVAVTGEAEDTFAALATLLLEGRSGDGVPGVATRGALGLRPFSGHANANFPLTAYPSPYLAGALRVDPSRSTYVETVRGCRSHCTFCFYPRSSNVLRALSPVDSESLIRSLGEAGATEVVFLDPTFNHRPDFDALLEALTRANEGGRMHFFAEVRAEGLTSRHAEALARAGFTKLEIGLQSVNKETLARTRRGGSPDLVAKAARMLRENGIRLLVDLIIGLPGDRSDDVARGVDFLREHGLDGEAQVFPLAVLPGTAMRASAEEDGLELDPAPPYLVRKTRTMSEDDIARAFEDAEDAFERPLIESPRPHLLRESRRAHVPDRLDVDVDRMDPGTAIRVARTPAAAHTALWIEGRDLWAKRDLVSRVVEARIAVDPHATLDVVLSPRGPMPLDVVGEVRRVFERAPRTYGSRVFAFRGVDIARRVCAVLRADHAMPVEALHALAAEIPVYRDASLAEAARLAGDGAHEPGEVGLRIIDRDAGPHRAEWKALRECSSPETVVFADEAAERSWIHDVMGYSDIHE